jgi:hypothetical protein
MPPVRCNSHPVAAIDHVTATRSQVETSPIATLAPHVCLPARKDCAHPPGIGVARWSLPSQRGTQGETLFAWAWTTLPG